MVPGSKCLRIGRIEQCGLRFIDLDGGYKIKGNMDVGFRSLERRMEGKVRDEAVWDGKGGSGGDGRDGIRRIPMQSIGY